MTSCNDLEFSVEYKGERELNTTIHFYLLPNSRCSVDNCLRPSPAMMGNAQVLLAERDSFFLT